MVCGSQNPTQAVTAGKWNTTTVIRCGSATGAAIPPFFIFAGKRMVPVLMGGETPGAVGKVSDWVVKLTIIQGISRGAFPKVCFSEGWPEDAPFT